MTTRTIGSIVLLAFAFAPLAAQQRANVGEKVPDVTFPTFVNGDGRQKLSDFFGQPVVIEMWGTRCPPCVGTAVPNAIKHDLAHKADGLVTILVESQGSNAEQHEAFLWKTFPTNEAFACTGTFVPVPESRGIPYCAVIGVDGTLLWVGNPAATPKPVEDLVAAELQKVKKGWGETPEIRKVRALLYGKNDFAGAAALVDAMADGEAKTRLRGEVEARYAIAKNSVAALQEQGNLLQAQARARELLKSVGQRGEWVAEVAPMVAAFDAPELKAGLALDRKLDKVIRQLRDKKGDNAPKALQALLKDREGADGKVAQRAQRLLTVLQTAPAAD